MFSEQDHKTIEQYWEEENALFARGSAGTPEEVAEMKKKYKETIFDFAKQENVSPFGWKAE